MSVSDYFAKLYVADRLANAGGNIYFPHWDKGFDFIVSKPDGGGGQILRPLQVKGKCPSSAKANKACIYVDRLTQTHPEMV
jgi:hypothetical protein